MVFLGCFGVLNSFELIEHLKERIMLETVTAGNYDDFNLVVHLTGSQFLDPDVAPAHLVRLKVLSQTVNLKADGPFGVHRVFQIGAENAVHPRLDRAAATFDAVLVPLVVLEGILGCRIVAHFGDKESPSGLVVDPAAGAPLRLGDLDLIAVDAVRRDGAFPGLIIRASEHEVRFALGDLAANLDAGIQAGIAFNLEFQDVIAVFLVGA